MHIQQRGNTSKYVSLGWWPFAADPAPWNSPSAVPSTGPSIPALLRTGVSGVSLGTQSAKAPLSSLCWVLSSLGAASPPPTEPHTAQLPPFVPEDTGAPQLPHLSVGCPFTPLAQLLWGLAHEPHGSPLSCLPASHVSFLPEHSMLTSLRTTILCLTSWLFYQSLVACEDGMVEELRLKGLDPQKRL